MTDDNSSNAVTTKFVLAVDEEDEPMKSVAVAGSFTGWSAIPLDFIKGCWEAKIGVTPGRHQYKFILDGEWIHDQRKHSVENDQGSRNNTLMVFRGANVTEVASSCLKNMKSGTAYREKREILKPVSAKKVVEKFDEVDELAKKEAEELEAARIEAERTHDQEAILRDIREGLIKNAIKREILTPQKEPMDYPVYDVLDDTEEGIHVDPKQAEEFVPKNFQVNKKINWGEENGEDVGLTDGDEEWKVGDSCVAKWRGRDWYNGRIMEIIHDQVLVKYLDSGDEDYANINELKPPGSLKDDGTVKPDDGTLKPDDNPKASTGDPTAATEAKLGKSNTSTDKKPTLALSRCAE